MIAAAIFLVLGIIRLSSKIVKNVPASLKAGILLGAGVAAFMGELKAGGRIPKTPLAIGLGSLICFYMLFGKSFLKLRERNGFARLLGKYGMVPAMVLSISIGMAVKAYPLPDIQWGITIFSGCGTFWISGFIALCLLPLVSFFKPFLPIGLSLTLVVTGYLCIITAFKQVKDPTALGVAGTMAVVLAIHGAAWGLGSGIVLHIFLERRFSFSKAVHDKTATETS